MLVKSFIIILIVSFPLFIQAHRKYVHAKPEKSWDDAQKYCRKHHTDLAVFGDQAEYEGLQDLCGTKWCWIGLYREAENLSEWKWSNGEKVSFQSWANGEPSTKREMCVKMKEQIWYDYTCSQKEEMLCYEEDDLILVKEEKTWEEALEYCRTHQTDPTSNNTDHLYDLPHLTVEKKDLYAKDLIQNAQTQELWIGLRFLAGCWFWVDSFPLEEQLKKDLPVCPAPMMHCGTMSKTGGFFPKDCSERRNFFCLQKKSV